MIYSATIPQLANLDNLMLTLITFVGLFSTLFLIRRVSASPLSAPIRWQQLVQKLWLLSILSFSLSMGLYLSLYMYLCVSLSSCFFYYEWVHPPLWVSARQPAGSSSVQKLWETGSSGSSVTAPGPTLAVHWLSLQKEQDQNPLKIHLKSTWNLLAAPRPTSTIHFGFH